MNCKHEHTEDVTVCKWCGEPIESLSSGNEGWWYCESCQQIEPDTRDATYCLDCDELLTDLNEQL